MTSGQRAEEGGVEEWRGEERRTGSALVAGPLAPAWEQTCSLLSAGASILSPKIHCLITSISLPLRVFWPLLFAPLVFNVDFLLFHQEPF